jgi:predicted DCC family thiol-disulfide oxidoreductase YuxK
VAPYDPGTSPPPSDNTSPTEPPLVLFDGVCNLCNASVRWIIERDRREVFRFASLQSRAAEAAIASARDKPAVVPDSIILVECGRVLSRSDAVLAIASRLGFPWNLAAVARIVPRGVRDALYAWIAANRYRWFGRREACMVPRAGLSSRFLDADEGRGM